MTKKEKKAILTILADYAEPAGYYYGRGMKDEATESFRLLRAVKETAEAAGMSREEITEESDQWRKRGERRGKAELAADQIDLSEFKSYKVYEYTENLEEPEKFLFSTPHFVEAYQTELIAKERGRQRPIFFKCVRHDGTEIPYIGGTHEN